MSHPRGGKERGRKKSCPQVLGQSLRPPELWGCQQSGLLGFPTGCWLSEGSVLLMTIIAFSIRAVITCDSLRLSQSHREVGDLLRESGQSHFTGLPALPSDSSADKTPQCHPLITTGCCVGSLSDLWWSLPLPAGPVSPQGLMGLLLFELGLARSGSTGLLLSCGGRGMGPQVPACSHCWLPPSWP